MYKNTKHTVEITDFGSDGEGICRIDGYTVFVPSAVKGDICEILIVKENKNYGFGKLFEVKTSSPLRKKSVCPVFDKCGGCTMQSVTYDGQLEYKKDKVRSVLKRIGGFENAQIDTVTKSPAEHRYRNKAQYPLTIAAGNVAAGFYAPHSHRVVPYNDCPLQDSRTNDIVQKVVLWANEEKIPIYSEESGKGVLRRICVRIGKDEAVLVLVCAKKPKSTDPLTEMITQKFPFVKGIVLNYNPKRINTVYGEDDEIIFGVPYIYDSIGDIKYKIHYKSFYQVNPYTTTLLYEKALSLASPTREQTVFDLYCGIGTISLFLAKKAKKVIGIEIVPDAVENARENAAINNIHNAEFYCGEAEIVAPTLIENGACADIVVVDPPRKGCDTKLLNSITKMNPEKIVYVSCDPATMARDAKILCEYGYVLKDVHVFDQFPQTSHVESVVLMERADSSI